MVAVDNRFLNFLLLSCVSVTLSSIGISQPRATKTERLSIQTPGEWQSPRFSPRGTHIYFTSSTFNGIWEFELQTELVRQIASDNQSGFGFTLSDDGSQIAYRKTDIDQKTRRATYEVVVKKLDTGASTTIAAGPDLSPPAFLSDVVVYTQGKTTKNLQRIQRTTRLQILGIENTKIAVWNSGRKIILDPLGNGRYIWPTISPDRALIAAYDMERGAFICDVKGRVVSKLGKVDGPSWTRSGKWIIYMNDRDDGHQIISSDISFVSPDGGRRGKITDTPDIIELNPTCSPTENKIVYQTARGEIFLLTYTE